MHCAKKNGIVAVVAINAAKISVEYSVNVSDSALPARLAEVDIRPVVGSQERSSDSLDVVSRALGSGLRRAVW